MTSRENDLFPLFLWKRQTRMNAKSIVTRGMGSVKFSVLLVRDRWGKRGWGRGSEVKVLKMSLQSVIVGSGWLIMSLYVTPLFKYMIFHIFTCILTIYRYITNSQRDQLPVGSIAQLVELCTGIAEVMGLNPFQTWRVFRLNYIVYITKLQ